MDGAANTTPMRMADPEGRTLDLPQEHGVTLRTQGEHIALPKDLYGHVLALPASLPGLVAREIRRGQRLGGLAE